MENNVADNDEVLESRSYINESWGNDYFMNLWINQTEHVSVWLQLNLQTNAINILPWYL